MPDCSLTQDDTDLIKKEKALQNAYNNRWYNGGKTDAWFVMYNHTSRVIHKDETLILSYGKRSNLCLLEEYGFSLDHTNRYDSLTIRCSLLQL